MQTLLKMSVVNRIEQLGVIQEKVESLGLSVKNTFDINLILDELVSNTVSYGYDDDAEHTIDLVLEADDTALHLTLTDDARPFDPTAASAPDLDLSLEEKPIGGLGIHLVRNLTTRFDYERIGNQNKIYLVLEKS